MDKNSLVFELLNENYQIECETVGPTNLEDIVGSEVEFAPAEYGSNIDLGAAVKILIAATSFIKNIIDIYIALKKEFGRSPDEAELVVKVTTKKDLVQKIDKNAQEKLIQAIVKKMKAKK